MEEYIVPIEGFPNYAVSSYGRIINVSTDRDLNPVVDKNGFHKVVLYNNGIRGHFTVHRLVARAFFINYKDGRKVAHISRNRNDNSITNLTITDKRVRTSK